MTKLITQLKNAIANGAQSVMLPTTEPWGQRTSYVADPDGRFSRLLLAGKPDFIKRGVLGE